MDINLQNISDVFDLVGGVVTTIALPLLGVFLFYDSRKRAEVAKAKQAEAEAKAAEEDTITSYAQEWKALYEKRDAEADKLKAQAEADRQRIRELQEKNTRLTIELQASNFLRCEVKKCEGRQPPTGY